MGTDDATSLGTISAAPYGSPGILPISYAYIKMMGAEGLTHASKVSGSNDCDDDGVMVAMLILMVSMVIILMMLELIVTKVLTTDIQTIFVITGCYLEC
jgi:hypothetical protein